MDKIRINYSAPNLVAVCIDNGNETGRIYHRYGREPVVFSEYRELMLKLDDLFDRIGCPQAAAAARSFRGGVAEPLKKEPVKPVVEPEELMAVRGEVATFLIHVRQRQRASWQGECWWLERGIPSTFFSELDLLKLLDAAR